MSKFVKEQEAEILKSVLGIKVVLSKFLVLVYFFLIQLTEILKKLLFGDKCVTQIQLKPLAFADTSCRPFANINTKAKTFSTSDNIFVLNMFSCFQHTFDYAE